MRMMQYGFLVLLFECLCQTKLKVSVTTTNEENVNLQSQILESPEELKTQMEKMKESVKNIKSATVSREGSRGE